MTLAPDSLKRLNISYWFKKETIEELLRVKAEIDEIKNKDVFCDFFYVCLSKTVRDASMFRCSFALLVDAGNLPLKDASVDLIVTSPLTGTAKRQ